MKMMRLQFDLGNTRVKWRLGDKAAWLHYGSAINRDEGNVLDQITNCITEHQAVKIEQIQVASVLSEQRNKSLSAELSARFGVEARFAKVISPYLGLRCGYKEPNKLGVDRWLAMLAASRLTTNHFCVIDLGSAITLDIVNRDGQHLGGYIVPGFRLLAESLNGKTSEIQVRDSDLVGNLTPGSSTDEAVHHGLMNMILGFIEYGLRNAPKPCQIFVTGGDGIHLKPQLPPSSQYYPALVLDGLNIALP